MLRDAKIDVEKMKEEKLFPEDGERDLFDLIYANDFPYWTQHTSYFLHILKSKFLIYIFNNEVVGFNGFVLFGIFHYP